MQGNLKGYDHTINLILEGCSERIYSQARGVEQVRYKSIICTVHKGGVDSVKLPAELLLLTIRASSGNFGVIPNMHSGLLGSTSY